MDNTNTSTKQRIYELQRTIRELELKVAKLQRERGVFAAKARLLSEELEKYRSRELRQDNTVESLLERQREMNVMLNRSNIMLSKAQNATAMLSLEFGELARALPETIVQDDEGEEGSAVSTVDERINRINDLFKKTGELSQEIADTLYGAQQAAADPQQAHQAPPPPPPPPPRAEPQSFAGYHNRPEPNPGHVDAAEPEPQDEAPVETPQPADAATGHGPAAVEQEAPAVDADEGVDATAEFVDTTAEVVTTTAEVVVSEEPAGDNGPASAPSEDEAIRPDAHAAVPRPRAIYEVDEENARRKRQQQAGSAEGAAGQPTDAVEDPGNGTATAETDNEFLDQLADEQEKADAAKSGRKKGFWSRLLGG